MEVKTLEIERVLTGIITERDTMILELHTELVRTKERLDALIEKMDSTNSEA